MPTQSRLDHTGVTQKSQNKFNNCYKMVSYDHIKVLMTERHKDNTAQRQHKTDILSLPVPNHGQRCTKNVFMHLQFIFTNQHLQFSFTYGILQILLQGLKFWPLFFFYFGSTYVKLYLNYNRKTARMTYTEKIYHE